MLGACIERVRRIHLFLRMDYPVLRVCSSSDWFTHYRIHPCPFGQAVSPLFYAFETSSETSSR